MYATHDYIYVLNLKHYPGARKLHAQNAYIRIFHQYLIAHAPKYDDISNHEQNEKQKLRTN